VQIQSSEMNNQKVKKQNRLAMNNRRKVVDSTLDGTSQWYEVTLSKLSV
jgi:hypothetical protein